MDTKLAGERYALLSVHLDERGRRLLVAAEALVLGHGGITAVALETGVSRPTITAGIRELEGQSSSPVPDDRVRREGGGRKSIVQNNPEILTALDRLVDPVTRGDPESPLRWTCKSLRKLADELVRLGFSVSYRVVGDLLEELGYSLQANAKTNEGRTHPDREAQFSLINAKVEAFQADGQPAISVDTKKKELVGDFKNAGREIQPKGEPEAVRVHDFLDPALGKVSPYGIYDIANNAGWVSVGIDHDTAAFAVRSIESWWTSMGQLAYPNADRLLITADGGGSNGYRLRLWKTQLQEFADRSGLALSVSHLPPGTSKWNKIEHRLFSFISQNWLGKPLISHEVIVSLIAPVTTRAGLTVKCQLDTNKYPTGTVVTDEELSAVNIERDDFHGEWNYTIHPRKVHVIS